MPVLRVRVRHHIGRSLPHFGWSRQQLIYSQITSVLAKIVTVRVQLGLQFPDHSHVQHKQINSLAESTWPNPTPISFQDLCPNRAVGTLRSGIHTQVCVKVGETTKEKTEFANNDPAAELEFTDSTLQTGCTVCVCSYVQSLDKL